MSQPSVPTAMAAVLQNAKYFNRPLEIYANSTLNEKLNIAKTELPAADELPVVKYVVIGAGGLKATVNSQGRLKMDSRAHKATDTALFDMTPFVLRTLDNDLTAQQREKYRLRRMLSDINGVDYVGYYARVLDLSQSTSVLEKRHVENGVVTADPWSPTLEDMNPVPTDLPVAGATIANGDYIATTTKVPFVMSPEDVQEYLNAVKILYGDEGFGVIAEMATVSGIDRVITSTIAGQAQSYTEAIYAQCACFIATAFVMRVQIDGLQVTLDVGNVEALLEVKP